MVAADVAWMLVATALVLLMTPGVAFFYGGMVSARNAVSTKFQSFVLRDVSLTPSKDYASTIPEVLFMLFQATFAIVTPALITGAVAERIRFKAWLIIMPLWSLLVYAPVAHWVWGNGGWIAKMGGLDFAGGLVVHMTSGYAALVAALTIGRRNNFPSPSTGGFSAPMVLLGTALLWFGWFGFNAGSALAANSLAAQAFGTTMFAPCAAMVVWMICDWMVTGKPTAVGAAVGAVAGLVAITPAAGFVTLQASIIIGAVAAVGCHFAVRLVKDRLKTDDTVDVFACHGVGGTIGTILTAVFATKTVNAAGADGVLYGGFTVLKANLTGAAAVIVYTMVMTYIVLKIVEYFMPLRVTTEEEESGLDQSQHGERAFVFH
jgi:Amt family ammonium transporter